MGLIEGIGGAAIRFLKRALYHPLGVLIWLIKAFRRVNRWLGEKIPIYKYVGSKFSSVFGSLSIPDKIRVSMFALVIFFVLLSKLPAPCVGNIVDVVMNDEYEFIDGEFVRTKGDYEKFKFDQTESLTVYTHCEKSIWEYLHTASPEELENVLMDVEETLGLNHQGPIWVYLVPNVGKYTDSKTFEAFADTAGHGGEIFLPMDGTLAGHEFAHIIVANDLNYDLPEFFEEGIAVYIQFKRGDKMAPWYPCEINNETIVEDINGYDAHLYASAGSFTNYLIETYGLEKFKKFLSSINRIFGYEYIDLNFQRVYGFPLQEAIDDWSTTVDFGDRKC